MKNKKIVAGLGILAVAVVGGTFAYFNQTTTIDNPFSTTSFEGTTVEKFNPTDGGDWKPGAKVDKTVTAQNTGDGDVWVRVKLNENWDNANGKTTISSGNTQFLPSLDKGFQTNNGLTAVDGLTNGDGSVVYKELDAEGWTLGNDGYYYYNTTLTKDDPETPDVDESKTNKLLKSVTLCQDADMGLYESKQYYKVVEKNAAEPTFDEAQWEEYTGDLETALENDGVDAKNKDVYTNTVKKLNKDKKGYASDNYTLSIITEFVQADAQAADASGWVTYPGK